MVWHMSRHMSSGRGASEWATTIDGRFCFWRGLKVNSQVILRRTRSTFGVRGACATRSMAGSSSGVSSGGGQAVVVAPRRFDFAISGDLRPIAHDLGPMSHGFGSMGEDLGPATDFVWTYARRFGSMASGRYSGLTLEQCSALSRT